MLPDEILVHTAMPVSYLEPQSSPATWIEGEPGPQGGGEPVSGVSFPCVLFLPGPGGVQDTEYRPRVLRAPTLLYNVERDDGSTVTVTKDMELLIEAAELAAFTGADTVRWLVDGDPQPFGPPGEVFGAQAIVRQVRD